MKNANTVVFSLLGSTLDAGEGPRRWSRWRPNVAICQQPDWVVGRFELLYQRRFEKLARTIRDDIQSVSPETKVQLHQVEFKDAWNLEDVYSSLREFVRGYSFKPEEENYLIHITTGTHIAQICMFLLTEARYFPGKLLQMSPPNKSNPSNSVGNYTVIDLDLSKYDKIASRFRQEQQEAISFLKSGIETRNAQFNKLIDRIEKVAIRTRDPLLLMGPTGAGKSRLAEKIYELKRTRHQINGPFVAVNCATLRGDGAMSALFGHVKGSFTGALAARPGLLKTAHQGILFLDEIGELGLEEQAMLLRAIEEKEFLPVGSDKPIESDFQLIAGTNRLLPIEVKTGRFREDLLARINLWTFYLPGLKDRPEDIEPNVNYELESYSQKNSILVTFNKEARERFFSFALSPQAKWSGNFRELNSSITRMATLGSGGRINLDIVDEEIERLMSSWSESQERADLLVEVIGVDRAQTLDLFDRMQLNEVIQICRNSKTISEAGRTLFSSSIQKRSSRNDADRLRKYLARFSLEWSQVK
jgi:transcriptional regulatory protein RtcR